jgi:putative ABC transport system permease protein
LAGLLSGIYPALVLSGFRPAATLRVNASGLSGSGLLRAALVVLQFAVSIGLGIAVAVVFAQIYHSRNIALGYQKDGVVVVNASGVPSSVRDNFMLALRANPGISATAISDTVPLANRTLADNLTSPGGRTNMIIRVVAVSPDFMDLYGVHLLAGRMLSLSRGTDKQQHAGTSLNVLFNATAARSLGFTPQGALGKTFVVHGTPIAVAGVVDDIKMDGPKQAVAATLYRYDLDRAPFVSVRVHAARLPDTLAFIDKTWHAVAPTAAIRRSFLSDNFASEFQADEKQGAIFGLFVGIAIFIACLGLFGLAAFTAGRRTREIGIRKVFGARNRDVIFLLLWQFSVPVLIANVIAWPLAWYYLRGWLQAFTDRISLNPLYFVGTGLAALLIAWATIFAHALRVARANPINALRTE